MKKITVLYILIQMLFLAGNVSANDNLDFVCAKYNSQPKNYDQEMTARKKCFEDVKNQLSVLGCEIETSDLTRFWPNVEFGVRGYVELKNCISTGRAKVGGSLPTGTQADCDKKADPGKSKYKFVKNLAKDFMFYGVCIEEAVDGGTLDFICANLGKTINGKIVDAKTCYTQAQAQLRKIGCEIDEIQTRERTHYGCNAKSCGILLLKNCRYAGGSEDGKVFRDGGTQESCNEGGYKFVRNTEKEKMFPGICFKPIGHQPSDGVPARDSYKR